MRTVLRGRGRRGNIFLTRPVGVEGSMTQRLRECERGKRSGRRRPEKSGARRGEITGVIKILPGGGGTVGGIRLARGATGVALDGDTVLVLRCGGRGGRNFYSVAEVLARGGGCSFGTVLEGGRRVTVSPDDLHLPDRILLDETNEAAGCRQGSRATAVKGDIVEFKITRWDDRRAAPRGEVTEVVGKAGDPQAADKVIRRRHGLPERFPEVVMEEALKSAARLVGVEMLDEGRLDLRGEMVVTIDPDDSRDFDDAIGVVDTGDGWRLSVHIADVSHYVRPGGAIDLEAARRGNSTYLPGKVIPMLPEALSNGACSLVPGEDRHSFAAFLDVERDGRVRGVRFAKCVIRSKARLTYGDVFGILSKSPGDQVENMLHGAHRLALALRARREAAGALLIEFSEARAVIAQDGTTSGFEISRGDDAHRLVEECMLVANEAVARKLRESGVAGIYRVHGAPDERDLLTFLTEAGDEDGRRGKADLRGRVSVAIRKARGTARERILVSTLMKFMKKAAYSPDPLGHYGLAKDDYAHFTSPIRRYADLLVHRALEAALTGKGGWESLTSIAGSLADTEGNSAAAEKGALHERKFEYLGKHLNHRGGKTMEGVVVEIKDQRLVVDIDEIAFRCTIAIPMSGGSGGLNPGDKVPVRVQRLDRRGRRIEFALAEDGEVIRHEGRGGGPWRD